MDEFAFFNLQRHTYNIDQYALGVGLIERVRRENDELDRLNRRYRPALMAYFIKRTSSLADAEDLTQDLFIKLATLNLEVAHNQDAYIFQMASNMLKDRARRSRTREAALDDIAASGNSVEGLDPARFLLGKEKLGAIVSFLQELPERSRTIFILYRIEGVSQQELAQSYNISIRAVQKHIAKALDHLIVRLKADGR